MPKDWEGWEVNASGEVQEHMFTFDDFHWSGPPDPRLSLALELNSFSHGRSGNTVPLAIFPDHAKFRIAEGGQDFFVRAEQVGNRLSLFCSCAGAEGRLCWHQAAVVWAVKEQEALQIFFNKKMRERRLREIAADFGLEEESDLDRMFSIELEQNRLRIAPLQESLMSVTKENLKILQEKILSESTSPTGIEIPEISGAILVLKKHKYYRQLQVELYTTERTKLGKLKNPLKSLDPELLLWRISDPDKLKFLLGVKKFHKISESEMGEAEKEALKAVVKNPYQLPIFIHDTKISESVTAKSLNPVQLQVFPGDLSLKITRNFRGYLLTAEVQLEGKHYALQKLPLKFGCFLGRKEHLYFMASLPLIKIVEFLKQKGEELLIHPSKFGQFKSEFLNKLEARINIYYEYISEATPQEQSDFHSETEWIIYLSDFGNHVMLIPVMRYKEVEISVRTKQQIYTMDEKGREALVKRNDSEEIDFVALLVKQHSYFQEQLENELSYFYLHKREFLNEEWFLQTFEEWGHYEITVLGFNEIEGNKIDPHKPEIDIKVLSGHNWFNVNVGVRFGKKKASLKRIHRAIKNKSKYILLDDGSMGILPEEWIQKFSDYFYSGNIFDEEILRIPKQNFASLEDIFEEEMLEAEVRQEINFFRKKLSQIGEERGELIPKELKGVLRPYQEEGLGWLNTLDQLNFGGCLADDMGLGKSIQIIAFILLLKQNKGKSTNLLVVPTTLMFNWKAEIQKFAPGLHVHLLQGAERKRNIEGYNSFDIILTSYNTLLNDISFLKDYHFNYIFLDESQEIKNPESQRYKTVCRLRSRNRISITGTPVENNSFDLYSQFSFVCPGLLGSKQFFKHTYFVPIDKFHNKKRATELQKKVSPFLLRRTKEQVARELPEKVEMILYCEMQEKQRSIYEAYEREFREYISATTEEDLKKHPMNVLKGLTRLRQICNSPKLLGKDELAFSEPSSKIESLLEQIEDHGKQQKILVFSQFVSMLELIKRELENREIGYAILTGRTKDREAVVRDFQENENTRIFLISLKAGGMGLNLTEASYVYLVDPWWNPAVEDQAIDRAHRIGQWQNVTAFRMICPDTVEEKILQLQETKKDLAKNLVRADGLLTSLSKNELLKLINK